MRARVFVGAAVVSLVLFSACAPGPNDRRDVPDDHGEVSGFWMGLWHGAIAPITFVVSLFSREVQPYEVHNNGGWYNFGFLLGLTVPLGGGARGAAGRSARPK
jgi:hypothetical protein